MYKSVSLFKRKPGHSVLEFRDYHESYHAPLKKSFLNLPGVERYMRRYLDPITDPIADEARNCGVDVITEVWFTHKAAFDAYREASLKPEYRRLTAEDESKFFDQGMMFFHTVEERDSDLSE